MSTKVDIEEVKSLIESSKAEKNETEVRGNSEEKESLEEYKESMARRSNIVVFKAVESKDEEPERRKRDDMEFVRDLCDIMEADYSSVKNVTRLGRRAKEEDNPTQRPMRIIFEDEKSKGLFMGNLRNLRVADEKYKCLSIVHDMTQKERQLSKEKWEEAKEKNKDSESGDFKYIVKGPPWERRVVRVKKDKRKAERSM